MHILYIHQYFSTPRGRTGTRSYEFARRWVAAGHRVTVLTSRAQLPPEDLGPQRRGLVSHLEIDGIEVTVLNIHYRQAMGFCQRVWAFVSFMVLASWMALRIPAVDLIYATSTPLTVGVPAMVVRLLRRRPYVFEVRDVWPAGAVAMGAIRNRLAIRLLTVLERTVYRWAEAVVALSPGMEAAVRQAAPYDKRVITVPNCCDTDRFCPEVDGSAIRRRRGWEDRFVCVHVGAIGPTNGLDAIVEAANRVRGDPDWLFVLVGEGSEKDRLQARCRALALVNVQFLGGIPKCDLPVLLAAADLALVTFAPVPILEHNSANKFFDALSAGKPVVLNYGGWQREVIEAAGAGLGCQMGDNEEFFAALGALKSAPARRAAMGRQARKLATERFSRDMLAARTLAVLVEAAGPDRVN